MWEEGCGERQALGGEAEGEQMARGREQSLRGPEPGAGTAHLHVHGRRPLCARPPQLLGTGAKAGSGLGGPSPSPELWTTERRKQDRTPWGPRGPLWGGLGGQHLLAAPPSGSSAPLRAGQPHGPSSVTSPYSPSSSGTALPASLKLPKALSPKDKGKKQQWPGTGRKFQSPRAWSPGRRTHLTCDLAIVVKVVQGEGPLLPAVLLHRHVTL